jgi:predicted DNA binding protein
MTVIVDIDLPADQFVLGDVVSRDANIQIELERIVPLDHAILPFLWVSDGSNDEIEQLLRTSEYVTSVTRLVTLEDKALYQLEWTQDVNGVIGALEDAEGVIMEGHGTNTTWSLRLRFTSHERFKEFADRCRQLEIDLGLRAVYNPHPPVATGMLTSAQREAIRVASERGYFKVPREVTLRELSEHFGVSEQAVSQRLRRGLDNLVAGSLDL